jgi:hypothetical protein
MQLPEFISFAKANVLFIGVDEENAFKSID